MKNLLCKKFSLYSFIGEDNFLYTSSERIDYATQKPLKLLERIIRLYTNENDIVADFFCGSGTSMVVAKGLDRNYIGCDINSKAIEITKKRLNELG